MARKKTDEEKAYSVLLSNIRELSKLRAGTDFIWAVLSICDIYSDSFSGNGNTTFYLEGKRAVGLQILQLLEDADPALYARMLLEKQQLKGVDNDRRDIDDGADGTDD